MLRENQPLFKVQRNEKMDPRNPDVIQAREANSEYIVYYAQERGLERWHFERVSDGTVVAAGSLQSMLALLPLYPNSRRATWAEDMGRYKPYFMSQEAVDLDNAVWKKLDELAK